MSNSEKEKYIKIFEQHNENGFIDGTVNMKVGYSKIEIVQQIARERNYDLNTSIAIGDGTNDIGMFKLMGFSVALNPKSDDVAEAAQSVYFSKNFKEVVESFLEFVQS